MERKLQFKEFLLTENKQILGHKVGDILQHIHDLIENAPQMGARLLVKRSEAAVNLIRKILHQPWPREEMNHLKALQKAGVAIMRAIEEKDDLKSILAGVGEELEKVSGKLGVPLNHLGSDSSSGGNTDNNEEPPPPEGKENSGDETQTPPPPPPQPVQMPGPAGQVGVPPGVPPAPNAQPGAPLPVA